jgi:putative SOS response-associated peptidase YedK
MTAHSNLLHQNCVRAPFARRSGGPFQRRLTITTRDGSPILTAAGMWDEWKNRETDERMRSFATIITEPNGFAAQIHDRMPAFLTEAQFAP